MITTTEMISRYYKPQFITRYSLSRSCKTFVKFNTSPLKH